VACEVVAMLRMPSILARLGTLPTLGLCLLLAACRWGICAATVSPWAMAVAQSLHAASYAAFHVAAVTHAHDLFGPGRRASGQAIYSSLTYGVGNVIGMFLSGLLYERAGMRGLFAAACGVALLGAVLVLAASRRELRGRRGL
jgi:MFS transporter, PPP family, 3-phenylpropionic acid transporter